MIDRRLVSFKTFANELDAERAMKRMQSKGMDAVVTKVDSGIRAGHQENRDIFLQVYERYSNKPLKVIKR
jgi:hypothetical protein